RMLRRSPGFTIVAIVTLALGIGANTAIFSAAYGILLKPLGYANPNRLVLVMVDGPGGDGGAPSVGEVNDLAAAPIFDSVAAARSGDLRLMAGGTPAMITTYRVTGNYFSTLGVRPLLGSPIVPAQIKAGRGDVIVLSYAFWQRQFGGDPAVIGKHVTPLVAPLDMSAAAPSSYTIIGVMPPGFHSPGYGGAEAWTPL